MHVYEDIWMPDEQLTHVYCYDRKSWQTPRHVDMLCTDLLRLVR